jgi:hypothetical protein
MASVLQVKMGVSDARCGKTGDRKLVEGVGRPPPPGIW